MIKKKQNFVVPNLETERLEIKGLTVEDIDFIFEHFSKEEINKYSEFENIQSLEAAIELYDKYMAPTIPGRFRLGLVYKQNKQLIGTLGFYMWSQRDSCIEVGFDLVKDYWGKGLMTEALDALLEFGFKELELNRVEAKTDPENIRCVRLLERLNFKKEGKLRKKYFYKGSYHDEFIYSILRGDWLKRKGMKNRKKKGVDKNGIGRTRTGA